jgi:hypothetical protein
MQLGPIPDLGFTAEDGSFTQLAAPGPGLLCARAGEAERYTPAELGGYKPASDYVLLSFNAVIPINPSEKDAESTTWNIALEPGRALAGTVVGPDDRPLAGAHVAGLSGLLPVGSDSAAKLETASFDVTGLRPREPRVLVFVHEEKKLAKVQKVGTDGEDPLKVRLEPTGTLAGRVLDANGRPQAGLKVAVAYRWQDIDAARREGKDFKDLPRELLSSLAWGPVLNRETTTDADGKFRIGGLVPGLKYDLAVNDGPGQDVLHKESLSVESGKDKDLGDLKPPAAKERRQP